MSVRAHQVLGDPRLAELDHSALLVLVRILHHLHEQSGAAEPGIDTLSRLTRKSARTVQRAINRLEAAGIMAVDRGGGRQKTNVYRFTNPVTLDDTVSGESETPSNGGNPVTLHDGVSDEKPRQIKTETPSKSTVNPVTLGDTRTEERRNGEAQAALPGIKPAEAREGEDRRKQVAFTFATTEGF